MENVNKKIEIILSEISAVLSKVDERQVNQLIQEILNAKKIVTCGAGRVGMAIRAFSMRLGHFGYQAYHLGDTTVPSIGEGDLFIVASGSGETQTIFDLVTIAKRNKAAIAAVTGNPESRIGKLADFIVKIEAPSKTKQVDGLISAQPMTTLNEQSLGLFFDAVVLCIMSKTNETHDSMWARHSNLE
jgi:6-phospho-3-hexuloisomerase